MSACTDLAGLLQDAADGPLPAADRVRLDAHLASCAACRDTLAASRLIRGAAAALPALTPPPRVWTALERRLAAETARDGRTIERGQWRRSWLAAAALLALAVGMAVLTLVPRREPPPAQAAIEPSSWTDQVEAGYGEAIAQLEALRRSSDATLDPQVAVSLDASLAVVDRAIAESRSALRAGAAGDAVRDGLHDALADKVSLLERAVLLLDENRDGDDSDADAGAAPQR